MLQKCWSPCFVKLSLKEISWNVCAPTSCTYLLILIGPKRTLKAPTSCVHVLMMQEWCAFRMCNAIVRNHLKSNFSSMTSSIPPKPDITSWVLSQSLSIFFYFGPVYMYMGTSCSCPVPQPSSLRVYMTNLFQVDKTKTLALFVLCILYHTCSDRCLAGEACWCGKKWTHT